jgi:hypothetical protein
MVNNVGTTPFWFGYSIDFWDTVGSRLLIAAVITGIFTAAASGLSSWISSAVTSKVQAIAGGRITAAELELQRSRERTAAANERIAGLDVAVAEANARAAEATQKAEEEKLARVRLEAQIAPRSLTQEQATSLVAALQPFAGTTAKTFVYPSDGEGQRLEQQIRNSLVGAGFTVYGPQRNADPGELKAGVIIGTAPSTQAAAVLLGEHLQRDGVFTQVSVEPSLPFILIWVGVKPIAQ